MGAITGPVKSFAAPFTATGRQRLAGEKIAGASSDLPAFQGALANSDQDLVPGSRPTTYQATGDQGVGQLERAARTRNPEPFLERAAAQNAARYEAVEGIAPQGNPDSVGAFFRQQLASLDQQGQAAVQAATGRVQGATEALGGTQPPQAYGGAQRASLESANAAAKANESRLWQAIDPDGKLAVNAGPIKTAAQQIAGSVNQAAGDTLTAQEANLIQAGAAMPDNIPFSTTLKNFRSNIQAAQRQLRVQFGDDSVPMRRLGQLKASVDQAIEETVNGRAAQDAHAVAAGHMSPEDTMLARIDANLEADRAAHYASANAREASLGRTVGGGAAPSARAYAGGGSPTVSGISGAEGAPAGRYANATWNQGVPAQSLTSNFDAAAAQRYAAARQATLERKQTFRQGAPGAVLAPGSQGAQFRVPDAQVGSRIWQPGTQGAQSVREYLTATGGQQPAVDALHGHVVSTLRSDGVIGLDGTLDAGKLGRWMNRYQGALSQTPNLKASLANAQTAQDTVDQISGARVQALRDYETSAAKNFLSDDPLVAVRKAFASGNPEQTFSNLVRMTHQNPDALAGLKRAVVQFIQERMSSTAESGTSGVNMYKADAFQKFVQANKRPLRQLFGGQGLNNLDMVAADMRRSIRSIVGSKIPGQSNTAQDIAAIQKNGTSMLGNLMHGGQTAIGAIIGEHAGEMAGHGALGLIGGAVLVPVVHAMRQAGLRTVDQLVDAAMLNPALARELIAKVPAKPSMAFQRRLSSRIVATIPGAAAQGMQQEILP